MCLIRVKKKPWEVKTPRRCLSGWVLTNAGKVARESPWYVILTPLLNETLGQDSFDLIPLNLHAFIVFRHLQAACLMKHVEFTLGSTLLSTLERH